MPDTDPDRLSAAWRHLLDTRGPMPTPIAASALGVSEAALLLTRPDVVPLRCELDELIPAMADLGTCMALTRRDEVVLESRGRYAAIAGPPEAARITGDGIDLLADRRRWSLALAVEDRTPAGPRRSVVFCDAAGHGVHRAILHERDAAERHDRFAERFRNPAGEPALSQPAADAPTPAPFADQAREVPAASLAKLLTGAAGSGLPLAIIVGCPGCTHRHLGPIQAVKVSEPWFNVFDKQVHCHIRLGDLAAGRLIAGDSPRLEVLDRHHQVAIAVAAGPDTDADAWRRLLERAADAPSP